MPGRGLVLAAILVTVIASLLGLLWFSLERNAELGARLTETDRELARQREDYAASLALMNEILKEREIVNEQHKDSSEALRQALEGAGDIAATPLPDSIRLRLQWRQQPDAAAAAGAAP